MTKKSLNLQLSGCSSCLKDEAGVSLVLKITDGFYRGSTIPIEPGRYVVGRNPGRGNLVFPMIYNVVSRVHFDLVIDDAGNIFVTNRSSHGTWVDDRLLATNEEVKVSIGTIIGFGKEKIIITTN
jgi:FHA domain.